MLAHLHPAVERLVRGDAPVVAAVQGSAAGAGLGLIGRRRHRDRGGVREVRDGLHRDRCDSRRRVELVPSASRGLRRALELTLTNRVLSAAEALEWGLSTRSSPTTTCRAKPPTSRPGWRAGQPRAFAGAKRLIHESLQSTFETHLALESDLIVSGGSTHDAAEGMTAFVEKRPPEFLGK